ncbi:Zinc finger CCCH domain-containing protein 18 [Vitis vinifera]|uniref:Zinc finger CCCH domain-containing protein 18 n=1 Tax=Vitis vinifera TaxID=29760 RepID=A0A438CJK0_VITVI|nr:Zinc finger CCCH domain-containing protein 18 [Vitis vinifera]
MRFFVPGVDVHLSSLKQYNPTIWEQSLVGSSIWAVSDAKYGIWKEAELESWDNELRVGKVVFRDDGSSEKLGTESISLSEYAEMSDGETDSSSEQSDSCDDEEEEGSQGLGFLESTALQRGIQTETAIFAKGIWTGIVDPLSVKVLPPKQSLDHALESHENEENKESRGKKRSRGGKRKRDKKFAAAARAKKDKEESRPDVFSLINTQLAMHGEALNGGSAKKQQNKSFRGGEERRQTGSGCL